jgi:hypothetical protein
MRPRSRRALTSKTVRVVAAGLLLAAAYGPAAGAERAPDGRGACSGATLTRTYTADAMTFRLQLDLDGCRWWNGSARNPVIWLSRDDGAGPADRFSMTACDSGPDPGRNRTTACEVSTTLPHPDPERAVSYRGEATWRWKDGTRRTSFDTRCTTADGTATCDDPVAAWHG